MALIFFISNDRLRSIFFYLFSFFLLRRLVLLLMLFHIVRNKFFLFLFLIDESSFEWTQRPSDCVKSNNVGLTRKTGKPFGKKEVWFSRFNRKCYSRIVVSVKRKREKRKKKRGRFLTICILVRRRDAPHVKEVPWWIPPASSREPGCAATNVEEHFVWPSKQPWQIWRSSSSPHGST